MELWEVIDKDGNKTGEVVPRSELPENSYHLGSDVWIINQKHQILIQKRSSQKRLSPNVWAMTGGSVIAGESSLETIIRETKEELGIDIDVSKMQKITYFHTGRVFVDTYLLRQEIDIKDIVMQEDEVSEVKWATFEEIEEIYQHQQFIENRWEYVRDILRSIQYIGKDVKIKIDRQMGSRHPNYPDLIYQTNYGYVPNTVSGDGEELDAYILGEEKPLKEFEGKCIAVLHRIKDNDDKLIISNQNYTEDEIREKVQYQEQYFESIIIK